MLGTVPIPENILESKASDILQWFQAMPVDLQENLFHDIFTTLQSRAAISTPQSSRDRFVSFVEVCGKSKSPILTPAVFSASITLSVFTSYMTWSSEDNDRALRHVLELVNFVFSGARTNMSADDFMLVQRTIYRQLVVTILRQATKPVVKASMKLQTLLLSKGSVDLEYIIEAFRWVVKVDPSLDVCQVWCQYIREIMEWMHQQFLCQVAGKLVSTIYVSLRAASKDSGPLATTPFTVRAWCELLTRSLGTDPTFVVDIMNYIFLPLFRAERADSLLFLEEMNKSHEEGLAINVDMDSTALLQLAALQVGKKVGLVEEPVFGCKKSSKKNAIVPIIMKEEILDEVLGQASYDVRLLAMSLLVSSASTTRPYSPTALELLRKYIPGYFSESDAKFRVDFLGTANSMYKRVRGAISLARRSIKSQLASGEQANTKDGEPQPKKQEQELQHTNILKIPIPELQSVLESHQEYLQWYLNFIKDELVPTASYQRHTMGLKVLIRVIKQENGEARIWAGPEDDVLVFQTFDGSWSRALFDLLMDPFDDIRDGSASVLKAIMSNPRFRNFIPDGKTPVEAINEFLPRVSTLATVTGRADYANGVARIYDLLYRFSDTPEVRLAILNGILSTLDAKVALAESDLPKAIQEAPTHGEFASLGYILQTCQETHYETSELASMLEIQTKLVAFGSRMWELVRDILCDNSPEGFLPDEMEDLDGIGTKDVLSYSFRSVDESSKLLRIIILGSRNLGKTGLISPSREDIITTGDLAFTQLATLRHRGAFTTAAHTFASCCQTSKNYEAPSTAPADTLLYKWYQRSLEAIYKQESTTRRSAGIPAMFTSILLANSQTPSFEEVMAKLMKIAGTPASTEFGSHLYQVHALNSLKDIFKSSQLSYLGVRSDKYLSKCLGLAVNCLQSPVWAIRNCGLILLRSIMDCLLGTNENKMMIEAGWDGKALRIHYDKYLGISPLLLQLLKEGSTNLKQNPLGAAAAEAVFPALDIIRRAGPPPSIAEDVQKYISEYLDSPVWHVREIAARALCSCLLRGDWVSTISTLLKAAFSSTSRNKQNHVHGVLLAFGFVLERHCAVQADRLQSEWSILVTLFNETGAALSNPTSIRSYHPKIVAAFLGILNTALEFRISTKSDISSLRSVPLPKFTWLTTGSLVRIQYVRWWTALTMAASDYASLDPISSFVSKHPSTATIFLDTIHFFLRLESLSLKDITILATVHHDFKCTNCPYDLVARNLVILYTHLFSVDFLVSSSSDVFEVASRFPIDLASLMPPVLAPATGDSLILLSGIKMVRDAFIADTSISVAAEWENFATLMRTSVHDDKPFDTRYAAVSALSTFFKGLHTNWEVPGGALFALYDALNDDDDEIRELAAEAAAPLLGGANLVPIEAASALITYMRQVIGTSVLFKHEVIARMTGAIPPATHGVGSATPESTWSSWNSSPLPISKALRPDNALFAIEEKNLFIDEIRELSRWSAVFSSLTWSGVSPQISELLEKAADRLRMEVEVLVNKGQERDGPVGWASKPVVFAGAARVTKSLREFSIKSVEEEKLKDVRERWYDVLKKDNIAVNGFIRNLAI